MNTTQQAPAKKEFIHWIAVGLLIITILSITLIAWQIVANDEDEAMTVLNTLLPVYGTWVGTVLAFYFGTKNFEAASEQSRALYQETQKATQPIVRLVKDIMRKRSDMSVYTYTASDTDSTILLSKLIPKFSDKVTRLPILKADNSAAYMVHKSQVDAYIAGGGQASDSLASFIGGSDKYSLGKGFVILAEDVTLGSAQKSLADSKPAQDIFITASGKAEEPITGWVSNVRLTNELKA